MAKPSIFYRSSNNILTGFITKQYIKGAIFWSIIIAVYVASKSTGFANLYTTQAARDKVAGTFSGNVGLSALLGTPHKISSIAGFTAWNTVGVVVILVSIWAILLTTKTLRGAEEIGTWEIFLAGKTTARQATIKALTALGIIIFLMYLITAIGFCIIGKNSLLNFSLSSCLFFALVTTSGAIFFTAVASLASQLMPTKTRATGLAVTIFGLSFIIRAAADVTKSHWLINFTPLGWIEKMQPLTDSNAVWLLPLFIISGLIIATTIYLSGKRDIGSSIFADKDRAKANYLFLSKEYLAEIRLNTKSFLSWLVAILCLTIFYSGLTKSAVQALKDTVKDTNIFNTLTHSQSINLTNVFLGVSFLIYMLIIMSFAAYSANRIRLEEASGLLDNYFVRPIRRSSWLFNRGLIITGVIIIAAIICSLVSYILIKAQSIDISYHDMILAGVNLVAPAIFTLGFGILVMSIIPRLTNILVYFVIGWSFLIDMLSSGLHLNHYILDTSLLNHVALVPAASINSKNDIIIALLGLTMFLIGVYKFNNRDIVSA